MTAPVTGIMAIDPGLTGAIAYYFPDAPDRVSVYDMPVVNGEVEPTAIARRAKQLGPTVAVVERINAMPGGGKRKMGATGAFSFGFSYATARTVVALLEIPMHLVTPPTWKKHFRLAGGDEGKEQARALALRLFPASAEHFGLKKHHGRAEAALLARYAAECLIRVPTTATRSGCAGDGETVLVVSPDLNPSSPRVPEVPA